MEPGGDFVRRIGGVHAYQWNPLRDDGYGPRLLNNFGDLLGPLVVELLLERVQPGGHDQEPQQRRLFSVGSVIHLAAPRDVVWGSGINGKVRNASVHGSRRLDVRAVRGPLSAAYMTARGIDVPDVYGDPALLLPILMPELRAWSRVTTHELLVAPNFNDLLAEPATGPAGTAGTDPTEAGSDDTPREASPTATVSPWSQDVTTAPGTDRWAVDERAGQRLLDPTHPLRTVLRTIAQSRFVVGSSLHAVVLADALGIPARFVVSQRESAFKYRDYLAGTGRPLTRLAGSVQEAVELGPHEPPVVDLERLAAAFPRDLWGAGARVRQYAGRPFRTAAFPATVTDGVLAAFQGGLSRADAERRWLDDLVPAAVDAAGSPDGPSTVDEAAAYRELVVPGLRTDALEPAQRELAELVERRDEARLAVAARIRTQPPRAELRASRAAREAVVLSLAVQVPRVRGFVERVDLVLQPLDGGPDVEARVPPSPFHSRQWHVDLDVLVPFTGYRAVPPGRWEVHVRLTDEHGDEVLVPVAPAGTSGLSMSGGQDGPPTAPAAQPAARPAARPWVLDVAPAPVPA